MKIAIISCSKTKRAGVHKAQDLYTSLRFNLSWEYANKHFDCVYILSAKHGLLDPETRIRDYNFSMAEMSAEERRSWSRRVAVTLEEYTSPSDELSFFCGIPYREHVIALLTEKGFSCESPLRGLPFGRQTQWLQKQLCVNT